MTEGYERRYAIKPDDDYFSAGVTPGGEQVIVDPENWTAA
jgi:hypothetical protein